jgi:hypothetical protein
VSRFSGRTAPQRPEADSITREAYSHEVSSAGFWAGDSRYPAPTYFAYTAPPPPGLGDAKVGPKEAFWQGELGLFLLPYDVVRNSATPDEVLLEFLHSTYEVGARLAGWDRGSLERPQLAHGAPA